MNKNYITIGALVIAVITLGIIGFTYRAPVVNVKPVTCPDCNFGATPGTTFSGDTITLNGSDLIVLRQPFRTTGTATTTACSMKIPAGDYQLLSFTADVTTGPTSAIDLTLGEATVNGYNIANQFALTGMTRNTAIVVNASSTAASSGLFGVLSDSANHWLVATVGTATTTTRGYCTAWLLGAN